MSNRRVCYLWRIFWTLTQAVRVGKTISRISITIGPPFNLINCSDICSWTLSVSRSSQFYWASLPDNCWLRETDTVRREIWWLAAPFFLEWQFCSPFIRSPMMWRPRLTFKHLIDYDNFNFLNCGFAIVSHFYRNITKNNCFDLLLKISLLIHAITNIRTHVF